MKRTLYVLMWWAAWLASLSLLLVIVWVLCRPTQLDRTTHGEDDASVLYGGATYEQPRPSQTA